MGGGREWGSEELVSRSVENVEKNWKGVANFRIWCHVTVANRATCPPDITELSTVFRLEKLNMIAGKVLTIQRSRSDFLTVIRHLETRVTRVTK